jgi:hypothetical protein
MPTQTFEYQEVRDIDLVNLLASDGWRLHSVVQYRKTDILYLMERTVPPTPPDA